MFLCEGFFSSCGKRGPLFIAVRGPLSRPLLLWSTGSRRTGSVVVAHGPSCSVACGIFPDQGMNLCPLHWQVDSQPLSHQGSPRSWVLMGSGGSREGSARTWTSPGGQLRGASSGAQRLGAGKSLLSGWAAQQGRAHRRQGLGGSGPNPHSPLASVLLPCSA